MIGRPRQDAEDGRADEPGNRIVMIMIMNISCYCYY